MDERKIAQLLNELDLDLPIEDKLVIIEAMRDKSQEMLSLIHLKLMEVIISSKQTRPDPEGYAHELTTKILAYMVTAFMVGFDYGVSKESRWQESVIKRSKKSRGGEKCGRKSKIN